MFLADNHTHLSSTAMFFLPKKVGNMKKEKTLQLCIISPAEKKADSTIAK